jgi:hypothetical protein
MTTTLSPPPKLQFFGIDGLPLVGGKLYTYAAGTTTPLVTYTDSTGLTVNTNPIILDTRGETNVWLSNVAYKFVLKTSTDTLIWTVDNISTLQGLIEAYQAALAAPTGSSLIGFIQAGAGAVATTVQARLRQSVSVKDFGAVGNGIANDDVAVQKAIDYMYANNICTLYFPDGTYYFNQPVTILFDGVPALNSFRFVGTSTACMGSASNPGPLYSGSTITGRTGITSMFIFSKTDLTVGNGYGFECSNISFVSGLGTGPLSAFVNYVGR